MENKYWKKTVSAVTAMGLLAGSAYGLTGCGAETAETAETEDMTVLEESGETAAMGRYLEEELALPEGTCLTDGITLLEDGTLRLLAKNENYETFLADSRDGGATWSTDVLLREKLGLSEGDTPGAVCMAEDGSVFAVVMEYGTDDQVQSVEEINSRYFWISADGAVKELDLQKEIGDGYPFRALFTEKGTVLLLLTGTGIREIDGNSGKIVHSYEEDISVDAAGAVGNCLITIAGEEIHYYDLETGEPMADFSALTQQISANPENLMLTNVSSQPVHFVGGDEEDSLFYVERGGIYRYLQGGNVVEKICDGALNSMSSPDIQFTGFARDEEGSFYLTVQDAATDKGRILKYTYSADTPTVPETELNIYSLKEDDMLRQVAAAFQKKYPDIYLNLEYGMDAAGAVTVTDALKTLNTEIMADKGPDVLLMDGMNQDTYIEKGLLCDISPILTEVELLDNIREVYTQEDGKVYTMPVKFGVPVLQGKKEDIERIKDLTTLADVVEDTQTPYNARYFPNASAFSPRMLLFNLMKVSASAWIREDGTLDQTLVKEFLEQSERIFAASRAGAEELAQMAGGDLRQLTTQYGVEELGINGQGLSLLSQMYRMSMGNMDSPTALADVYSVEYTDPSFGHRLWNGQAENTFLPSKIVGISAKTREKEVAELFVKFLFSEEGQNLSKSYGLPVTETALDSEEYWNIGNEDGMVSYISSSDQNGTEVSMEVRQASAETVQEFKELARSLTTPACNDTVITEAVVAAGERYLFGEISLEEAVEEAIKEVNLYLTE